MPFDHSMRATIATFSGGCGGSGGGMKQIGIDAGAADDRDPARVVGIEAEEARIVAGSRTGNASAGVSSAAHEHAQGRGARARPTRSPRAPRKPRPVRRRPAASMPAMTAAAPPTRIARSAMQWTMSGVLGLEDRGEPAGRVARRQRIEAAPLRLERDHPGARSPRWRRGGRAPASPRDRRAPSPAPPAPSAGSARRRTSPR